MFIQACLNGSRQPGEHPMLPLSAQELAQAALGALDMGASSLHIHLRNAAGLQTLDPVVCDQTMGAMRSLCPGIAVGVSTAAWIEPDVQRRLQLVQSWTTLPDFAAVNFSERGAPELCSLLLARGVAVEAGLSSIEDAQLLLALGLPNHCIRLLLEPDDEELAAALTTVGIIERLLTLAGVQTRRLLHGTDATAWPLLEAAIERGYDSRIGLEDTLTAPDGRLARDNAELVASAFHLVHKGAERVG